MTTIGSLSLSERLKLTKMYRSRPTAFGSLNKLVKVSGLASVKVSQFLLSKPSYTKLKNRRRNFPRLQFKARFNNVIWWLDLAQVDKLSSWNFNTKFHMISVEVFSRFVRVQRMRNKNDETSRAAFIRMCSDQDNHLKSLQKLWVDRSRGFLKIFEISVKLMEITYTILSARQKFVSLNVRLDLWRLWFKSIWKKEEPLLSSETSKLCEISSHSRQSIQRFNTWENAKCRLHDNFVQRVDEN